MTKHDRLVTALVAVVILFIATPVARYVTAEKDVNDCVDKYVRTAMTTGVWRGKLYVLEDGTPHVEHSNENGTGLELQMVGTVNGCVQSTNQLVPDIVHTLHCGATYGFISSGF